MDSVINLLVYMGTLLIKNAEGKNERALYGTMKNTFYVSTSHLIVYQSTFQRVCT